MKGRGACSLGFPCFTFLHCTQGTLCHSTLLSSPPARSTLPGTLTSAEHPAAQPAQPTALSAHSMLNPAQPANCTLLSHPEASTTASWQAAYFPSSFMVGFVVALGEGQRPELNPDPPPPAPLLRSFPLLACKTLDSTAIHRDTAARVQI